MVMGRFAYTAVFAALLAGCVPIVQDPARSVMGVSVVRTSAGPAAPSDAEIAQLERKADQICVRGDTRVQLDVEPAEADHQIIDMKLRCRHYDRLQFDYRKTDWSNLL
jgi:hypothetical protein